MYGKLFFDYNANGIQNAGEPAVAGASVQLKDNAGSVIAGTLTDSSGDYKPPLLELQSPLAVADMQPS